MPSNLPACICGGFNLNMENTVIQPLIAAVRTKTTIKQLFFPPTLTKKYVFWQIPESRLDHIKVPTAHTVHERRQEVGCQAATQETKQLQL